jgi:hypothetical protein
MYVGGTQLTEFDPKVIQACPNLISLNLHANQMTKLKPLLEMLVDLSKLRSLTLYSNPFVKKTKNFRMVVSYRLPQLHRLDNIMLTKEETHPEAAYLGQVMRWWGDFEYTRLPPVKTGLDYPIRKAPPKDGSPAITARSSATARSTGQGS